MAHLRIGVFDSGIGGKLIAAKITAALPSHQVMFKSDPQYFPYGDKSPATILKRLKYFVSKFQQHGCSIIVIACNTATTNVIASLRHAFPSIKFVGVEPPIKPIAQMTRTGHVAVMATPATIASIRHAHLKREFGRGLTLHEIACPRLAEVIETNPQPTPETAQLLKSFLDQPISTGVDVVGLACTHYPYMIDQMKALYPQVTFYDPAAPVVSRVVELTR